MGIINGKTSMVVSIIGVIVMLLLVIVNISSGYSQKDITALKLKLESIDVRTYATDRDVAVLKSQLEGMDKKLDEIRTTLKGMNP